VCALVIREYAERQKAFGKGAEVKQVEGPRRTSPRNSNL
jgi:endonuclease G